MVKSCLIAFTCSILLSAHAFAQTPKQVDVPAGDLGTALQLISRQVGVELVFRSDQVKGLRTEGVSGLLSAQDAVRKLLEGTPLQVSTDSATGAMMIGPTPAPAAPERDGPVSQLTPVILEEILVTGTHIRGVDNPTAPLIVMDREFIDSTGLTTAVQLIESLPQNLALTNQSATGGATSGNSFATLQGSSINLRGMGEGTTLTLVNGRRMVLGYAGSAVNIVGLPLSAIERVEVLTDGASALYGSDAVGGVVNFVFRKDFEGAETRALYGHADSVDQTRFSQNFGRNWQSGNVVVSAEYTARDMLLASDRNLGFGGQTLIPSLLPEDDTLGVTFFGRQDLTGNLDVFLDAIYTDRDSYNRSFQETVTTSSDVYLDNTQISATAGLGWKIGGGWRTEFSVGYGEDDLDVHIVNTGNAIRDNRLPVVSTLTAFDLKADGPLFEMPGGTVRIALGGHRREEDLDYAQIGSSATGVILSTALFEKARHVGSVFAEAFVPLIGASNEKFLAERLTLSLAARRDEYSDFGSSVDPRIGLAWQPVQGLKVRGSWGTSYLAPKLTDYDLTFNNASAINSFSEANGRNALLIGGNDPESLQAQEATNYSLGVDWTPAFLPGTTFTLNFYDIDYREKIETLTAGPATMLANLDAYADLVILDPTVQQVNEYIGYGTRGRPFRAFTQVGAAFVPNPAFDPAAVDVIIDARRRNIGTLETKGIDFSAASDFAAVGGNVHLGLDVAYVFEILKQVTPSSAAFDVVDTYRNPTHLRLRAALGYRLRGWSLNGFVHRKNSYTDDRALPTASIDSYTTVDVNAAYRFGEGAGVFSNASFTLAATNLFDREPPALRLRGLNSFDLGFDPANASPLGRLVTFDVTKRW